MKYVVSVSKTYKHRGLHRHRASTKKFWYVYYYDEYFVFHSEQVSYVKAMYYKTQKRKKMQYVCTECSNLFVGFVKSSKEEIECPYCEQ